MEKQKKVIFIDGLEFIFLFLGYSLARIEMGYTSSWLMFGLMMFLIIWYFYQMIKATADNK